MSQHDDLNRIVAALSRAAFNDTHWSVASALIDGACRVKSNTLFYGASCKIGAASGFIA